MSTPPRLIRWVHGTPNQLYYLFERRAVRYVCSWLVALGVCYYGLDYAWHVRDHSGRRDGNAGHTTIDFGGQWLAGRMIVEGHGKQLYNRDVQGRVLKASYSIDDEAVPDPNWKRPIVASVGLPWPLLIVQPKEYEGHDWSNLLDWFVHVEETKDPEIGGPLYPPVHALMYAPMAMLRPQVAYRVFQVSVMVALFLCGLAVNRLSRGRVWTPIAFLFFYPMPGVSGALNLGQNPPLSLALLLWGWVAVTRERPILAGFTWALLAFKPVWAAVFCLVPLLTGRWRMLFAMVTTGLLLIVATLPIVGVGSWLDWIRVGQSASRIYDVDYNWIQLSRDLLGLPRRWMVQFHVPGKPTESSTYADRRLNWVGHTVIGFAAMALVLEVTVRRSLLAHATCVSTSGRPAAFLILGAMFCCYHYMYYDLLLGTFPFVLLFLRPADYVTPLFWRGKSRPASDAMRDYFAPRMAKRYPLSAEEPRPRWTLNSFLLMLAVAMCLLHQWEWQRWDRDNHGTMIPWAQFALLFTWGYCGLCWPRRAAQ